LEPFIFWNIIPKVVEIDLYNAQRCTYSAQNTLKSTKYSR
jgi:hypothetical protein